MKERKTLEQMAVEAVSGGSQGIECPKCGCKDFRVYGGSKGTTSRFHYKACRHCGHKILTASQTVERIIRDVSPHEDRNDDEGEPLLLLLG
jgi:DNA-directed RNA polymerase subunit RPC12/RpoP